MFVQKICLSLDLLEAETTNDQNRSYLTIIRKNTNNLQQFIQFGGQDKSPSST